MNPKAVLVAILCSCITIGVGAHASELVRIATFEADVTPPIGSPLCSALVAPAARIEDPLSCRGMVLIGQGKPIVICALDWVGIGNSGFDAWKQILAEAAGTTPDRVALHCTHAHDAPGCDFDAEALLAEHGLSGAMFDVAFTRKAMADASQALKSAMQNTRSITHVGTGQAKVEKVASNRRVLGPDGRVKWVRYSATLNPEAIAQPEGVIDPYLYIVSFWDGDHPLASMSYYATHPQSHYGQGSVSCDFPGLARNLRAKELPGVTLLHFNGAGGNVAAGKYNDGAAANRPILTQRVAEGMTAAWNGTSKHAVFADDLAWHVEPVSLPIASHLDDNRLRATLANTQQPIKARVQAARQIAWIRRVKAGHKIDLTCLALGPVRVLHMPGELFVEYQLAAAKMRPDLFVTMAAYGDYGMGYIGTRIAYSQGGYEVGPGASLVDESVEDVLLKAIGRMLK